MFAEFETREENLPVSSTKTTTSSTCPHSDEQPIHHSLRLSSSKQQSTSPSTISIKTTSSDFKFNPFHYLKFNFHLNTPRILKSNLSHRKYRWYRITRCSPRVFISRLERLVPARRALQPAPRRRRHC